jgi:hypothetical protein
MYTTSKMSKIGNVYHYLQVRFPTEDIDHVYRHLILNPRVTEFIIGRYGGEIIGELYLQRKIVVSKHHAKILTLPNGAQGRIIIDGERTFSVDFIKENDSRYLSRGARYRCSETGKNDRRRVNRRSQAGPRDDVLVE